MEKARKIHVSKPNKGEEKYNTNIPLPKLCHYERYLTFSILDRFNI